MVVTEVAARALPGMLRRRAAITPAGPGSGGAGCNEFALFFGSPDEMPRTPRRPRHRDESGSTGPRREGEASFAALFADLASASSDLDEVAAGRLLAGLPTPPAASSAERALAQLLDAAAAPGSDAELASSASAAALLAGVAQRSHEGSGNGGRHARLDDEAFSWRRPASSRPRGTARIPVRHGLAAAVALGAVAAGGAAAAYTGSLPSAVQRMAHSGLGAPAPHTLSRALTTASLPPAGARSKPPETAVVTAPPAHSQSTPRPTVSSSKHIRPSVKTTAKPAVTVPVALGPKPCMDYLAVQKIPGSAQMSAWTALVRAAGGPERITQYCGPVLQTHPMLPPWGVLYPQLPGGLPNGGLGGAGFYDPPFPSPLHLGNGSATGLPPAAGS